MLEISSIETDLSKGATIAYYGFTLVEVSCKFIQLSDQLLSYLVHISSDRDQLITWLQLKHTLME